MNEMELEALEEGLDGWYARFDREAARTSEGAFS